jgi:hypothetical protein
MLDIKKLEINKLLKEYEFVKADYEYKSELIREADSEFLKDVDKILNKNSELKSIYNEKFDIKLKSYIDTQSKEISDEEDDSSRTEIENLDEEDNNIEDNRTNKIKKLYREIAKVTHTDKIINKRLNSLYVEASKFYSSNDIIGIYKICQELSIEYDIESSDIELLKKNIQAYRDGILFIESNHVWMWYNEMGNKDQMILNFIKKQIF